ncbi:MAG: PAS domain S-box protein [Alphaproteobacteria bacterium]|nr:PAS domain S-box protein [Alphaproteobacteria bacterium]
MLEGAQMGGISAAGAVIWGAAACVSLYVLITIRGIRLLFGTASVVLIALAASIQAGFVTLSPMQMDNGGASQLLLTLSSIPMLLAILLCAQYRQQRSIQETALANSITGIAVAGLDGKVQYANAAFCKLVGEKVRKDVLGRHTHDFFLDPSKAQEVIAAIRENGSWRGEVMARRSDGLVKEVDLQASLTRDAAGTPTAIIGSFADMSHSREKERQLKFSNSLLTNIVESAPILLWTADMDGEIGLVCGRGFDRIRQLIEEGTSMLRPAPGTSMYDLFRDVPDIRRHVARVLVGKSARFDWQCGDSVSFETHISPRYDQSGKVAGIVGVALDVSARVAAERALERNLKRQVEIEQRLDRAQRLEAVGRLTGGVAHDFNNLLTTILGNVDLIADKVEGEGELRAYAESAARAAERGAEMTQRLLAFSRQQALHPRTTDVHHLLDDLMGMLERTFPETISIRRDFDASAVQATVDPGQLENAILNLALNARDAMPEGGTLTVTTSTRPQSAAANRSRHRRSGSKDLVAISIRDTGTGMSQEVLEKAFEPFFTTKKGDSPGATGSGLGLSMVYGFVTQSKGYVEIESEPGKGTTVTLLLPRAEVQTGHAEDIMNELREIQQGSDRIMVVEDDPDVRQFIVNALKRLGYSVLSAENGPQAVEVATGAEQIDLLISDVVLPGGMSGPDVADRFLEIFPQGKVLFTSGYIGDDLVMRSRLESDVELLSKPYTLQALASKVRTVLDPMLH